MNLTSQQGNNDSKKLNPKKNTSRKITRKAYLLLFLLLAILIVGASTAYYMRTKDKKAGSDAKPLTVAEQKVDAAVNRTTLHPDYAAANTELAKQLAQTTDKKKQAAIYMSFASINMQQKQYQAVIDNLLTASKLDPSKAELLASTIGDAYARLGDKANAAIYYNKALAYYSAKPDNYSGKTYFINDLNAKIAALKK